VLVLVAIILAVVLLYGALQYLARSIVWPLTSIAASVAKVESGDMEARVPSSGVDEVATLAKANGLTIRSSRSVPAAAEDRQTFLNLNINASGEIGAIRDFLLQLRENPAFVLLKQLEIRQISAKEKRNYYLNALLAAPLGS